jgi:hypothetical protein
MYPGLYDWENSDNSGYATDVAYQGDAGLAPNSSSGDSGIESVTYVTQPAATSARPPYGEAHPSAQPVLTVIFKNGRDPEKIQNYMVNRRALTDLDEQHYEQIPLDQIDLAATEQANRAIGIDFQIPAPVRQ